MDTFKQELKTLLSRYPQVKNVRYTIEESVSVQEPSLMMPSMQVNPQGLTVGVAPADTKPQTPFDQAMSAAEATIAGITSRTSGKMTVTQS